MRSARRDVRATHPTRTLPGHHPKRPYPAAQVRRAAGRRRTKRAAPRGEGRVLGERRAGRPGRRRDDAARRAAGERVLGGLPAGDPRARHVPGHAGPRHGPFHPPHAEERAAKGIYLAFQYPVEIPGIANSSFLRTALNSIRKYNGEKDLNTREFLEECKDLSKRLNLDTSFLSRDLNTGFSGGEKKKNEIFHMLMMKPKLCILDEIDSGLDIDALKVISDGVSKYSNENNSMLKD